MSARVYHVEKVSLGMQRKYRISADDSGSPGALLAYAEKQLKASDETVFYLDEHRSAQLATVRESSVSLVAALTAYDVFDADERRLGSFRVRIGKSIQRTTWEFEQPGLGQAVGCERSLGTARVRRLIGLVGGTAGEVVNAVMKYHFDFEQDGRKIFSLEKPKVFEDWYRLTVFDDAVDSTLLFACAVTMESRQRG